MAPEKQLNNDIYVVSSCIIEIYGLNSLDSLSSLDKESQHFLNVKGLGLGLDRDSSFRPVRPLSLRQLKIGK